MLRVPQPVDLQKSGHGGKANVGDIVRIKLKDSKHRGEIGVVSTITRFYSETTRWDRYSRRNLPGIRSTLRYGITLRGHIFAFQSSAFEVVRRVPQPDPRPKRLSEELP